MAWGPGSGRPWRSRLGGTRHDASQRPSRSRLRARASRRRCDRGAGQPARGSPVDLDARRDARVVCNGPKLERASATRAAGPCTASSERHGSALRTRRSSTTSAARRRRPWNWRHRPAPAIEISRGRPRPFSGRGRHCDEHSPRARTRALCRPRGRRSPLECHRRPGAQGGGTLLMFDRAWPGSGERRSTRAIVSHAGAIARSARARWLRRSPPGFIRIG